MRRAINQAVYDLRLEISEACSKLADQRGEPADLPWQAYGADRRRRAHSVPLPLRGLGPGPATLAASRSRCQSAAASNAISVRVPTFISRGVMPRFFIL